MTWYDLTVEVPMAVSNALKSGAVIKKIIINESYKQMLEAGHYRLFEGVPTTCFGFPVEFEKLPDAVDFYVMSFRRTKRGLSYEDSKCEPITESGTRADDITPVGRSR